MFQQFGAFYLVLLPVLAILVILYPRLRSTVSRVSTVIMSVLACFLVLLAVVDFDLEPGSRFFVPNLVGLFTPGILVVLTVALVSTLSRRYGKPNTFQTVVSLVLGVGVVYISPLVSFLVAVFVGGDP